MTNLLNLQTSNFLLSGDVVRHGIDYLRLNFLRPIDFFEDLLRKLVVNSESIYQGKFTYSKINLSSGVCCMVSYSYNDMSIPIILYNTFGDNRIYKKYGRMDFYGSFFRMITIGEFEENYFLTYIKELTDENPTISRIDYCFDNFYGKNKQLPKYQDLFEKINISSKIYEIGKFGQMESWSIGSKQSKRYVVRMYDKLLDIYAKNKLFQYTDYLKYQSIHRFEVQFGPHFTRGFTLENFDVLLDKILSCMGISKKEFNGHIFYKYDWSNEINEFNKIPYIQNFQGRGKKLCRSNLNPYLLLFQGLQVECQTDLAKKQHSKQAQEIFDKWKSLGNFISLK